MLLKRHLATTFTLLFCAAGAAQATNNQICPPDPPPTECEAPDYLAYFPRPLGGGQTTCPGPSGTGRCLTAGTPPAPVTLHCDSVPNALHCEAWPQGEELTYDWSVVNMNVQIADPANPNVYLTCAGAPASVTVRVLGPNGEKAWTTLQLTCPK